MTANGWIGRSRSQRHPAEQKRFSAAWTLLFGMCLFVCVSRGLLELLLSKPLAYGVQVATVSIFVAALAMGGSQPRPQLARLILAGYIFLLSALASLWLTANVSGFSFGVAYVAVMIFYVAVVCALGGRSFSVRQRIAVPTVVTTVIVVLVVVATLQQMGQLTSLPGSDRGTFGSTVRPSSLTGSFLHYPITLGILSFWMLGFARQLRRRVYLIIGIVGFAAVLASLSRSGLVLCVVGLAAGLAMLPSASSKLKLISTAALFTLGVLAVAPRELFVSRVLSIFDSAGAGNTIRIAQWTAVVSEWTESPLWLGSRTGAYTNVTTNLTGSSAEVAESSVLQQLANFGLVGLVSFYALLWVAVLACDRQSIWHRAAMIGAIAQSAFYQSVEVFPFMVAFALTPFVASITVPQDSTLAMVQGHPGSRVGAQTRWGANIGSLNRRFPAWPPSTSHDRHQIWNGNQLNGSRVLRQSNIGSGSAYPTSVPEREEGL